MRRGIWCAWFLRRSAQANMFQRDPDHVILASCSGDTTGGGLCLFDGRAVARLDRLSSTGLFLDGERLLRLLWCPSTMGATADLVVYDHHGIASFQRLDGVADCHDVFWDGDCFVVVSTGTGRIVWFSPAGERVREWVAPGEGDCRHLNSLLPKDGRLLVCAFGTFLRHREWNSPKKLGAGVVFDIETGENVLTGLTCPHNPWLLDGAWLVCNSGTSELLRLSAASGKVDHRLQLEGWTRGVAVTDELIFVGESRNHLAPPAECRASIAVIDRANWTLLDRFFLPSTKVYDLVLVPRALAEGVRKGFGAARPGSSSEPYDLLSRVGAGREPLWTLPDPLPPSACTARITAAIPKIMRADEVCECECMVENLGGACFTSAAPFPVLLSYRWFDATSSEQIEEVESLRSSLPKQVPPLCPMECKISVKAPPRAGDFVLLVTLVQEYVTWFDTADPASGSRHHVSVIDASAGALAAQAPGVG